MNGLLSVDLCAVHGLETVPDSRNCQTLRVPRQSRGITFSFNILTLNGKAVQNKGMALFPRKIDDSYVMLSRQDGENNHIMFSDNIHFWQKSEILQEPTHPWEFIQIGNCGSPLETDEGWIVLTHGV